jgi:hypothetical protein
LLGHQWVTKPDSVRFNPNFDQAHPISVTLNRNQHRSVLVDDGQRVRGTAMSTEVNAKTGTTTRTGGDAVASTDIGTGLLRGLTAAGVLLSAVVHLQLYTEGFKDIATIGPLFMLNAIAGLLIGTALLIWPHWLTSFVAAGFGAATLAAFYISVTVGLFGLNETAGGTPQVLAEVAEWVALVFGATLLATQLRPALAKRR